MKIEEGAVSRTCSTCCRGEKYRRTPL